MAIEYVDFHFDVMCPWAYQGSKWIREVRSRTGLEVRWKFFSLEEINRVDGKIVGDVHPGVAEVAGWVAPNPGGVGPMTRAQLLVNVVEAAERSVG